MTTLRDAFRAQQTAIITAAGIPWSLVDTLNTNVNPDASTGYIELEFPDGDEYQYTTGAPGFNWHREHGQVVVHVVAPLGRDRDNAESYAETIRAAFRARKFSVGSRTVRITGTTPVGEGYTAGGMRAESVTVEYEVFNVG